MEYQYSYNMEKIVNDPETVLEESKDFVDQCYEQYDGEMYLEEDFIVNMVK